MLRQPKDMVKNFLLVQYSRHGKKFFTYLFGSRIATLVANKETSQGLIDALSTALVCMKKKLIFIRYNVIFVDSNSKYK